MTATVFIVGAGFTAGLAATGFAAGFVAVEASDGPANASATAAARPVMAANLNWDIAGDPFTEFAFGAALNILPVASPRCPPSYNPVIWLRSA